jgi:hypothetical protein
VFHVHSRVFADNLNVELCSAVGMMDDVVAIDVHMSISNISKGTGRANGVHVPVATLGCEILAERIPCDPLNIIAVFGNVANELTVDGAKDAGGIVRTSCNKILAPRAPRKVVYLFVGCPCSSETPSTCC